MGSMKVIWNDEVIAEAPTSDLIRIEGNWYFPPKSMNQQFFEDSDHHTTCHWKGEASYYDVVVNGKKNEFGAWYYPVPKEGSVERVKHDFSNYVAFWNGIEVTE
jgi:uncharacterized protein (DUF427 family)